MYVVFYFLVDSDYGDCRISDTRIAFLNKSRLKFTLKRFLHQLFEFVDLSLFCQIIPLLLLLLFKRTGLSKPSKCIVVGDTLISGKPAIIKLPIEWLSPSSR